MIQNLVSVLLPVYNQKNTLKESIDSVLTQTYSHLELIILNDGSIENLEDVISIYKDPRINYVLLPHQGLPATLNYGLKIAKGEFITWTSADNIMMKNMIFELVNALEKEPNLSAAYAGYYHIDKYGRITGENRKCEYCFNPLQFMSNPNREFLVSQYCNFGAAFVYRASACNKAGEFDVQCEGIEDIDYSLRIAKTGRVKWVDKILYKYRIHEDSMSGREQNKKVSYILGRQRFWNKILKGI